MLTYSLIKRVWVNLLGHDYESWVSHPSGFLKIEEWGLFKKRCLRGVSFESFREKWFS